MVFQLLLGSCWIGIRETPITCPTSGGKAHERQRRVIGYQRITIVATTELSCKFMCNPPNRETSCLTIIHSLSFITPPMPSSPPHPVSSPPPRARQVWWDGGERGTLHLYCSVQARARAGGLKWATWATWER